MGSRVRAGPCSARTTAPSSPADTWTERTPGQGSRVTPTASTVPVTWGHRSTGTTSWLRWAWNPARPERSTAYRTRVRQPRPVSSPGARPGSGSAWTTTGPPSRSSGSTPPRRRSCSVTTAALSRRCSASSTCCRSQPPHPPGWAYGHGGTTRCGDGSRTCTASPRQKLLPSPASVRRTRTRSPGRACRTNTTRPSGASSTRATTCPPCAMRPVVMVSRSSGLTRRASGRCPRRPSGRPPVPTCAPRQPGPRGRRRPPRRPAATGR